MDKFRMMFQFLQSNQESFMNGICGIMALASAQLYSAFEFSCPCIPEYNYSYGIGLLVVPPIWFFLLGWVLNNNVSMLVEEWKRPMGKRQKDPAILRYMFISITQRSLIAPAVWIAVTLMDGKSFLCAFSVDLDIYQFGNASLIREMSETERIKVLATIPCKNIFEHHNVTSREAASRYIKCISQAFGWAFLLMMTMVAFLIRAIRPCFTQAAFLKTKYWSHYVDIERKMFEDTCKEHAKTFAKVCVQQYFESVSGEMRSFHRRRCHGDSDDDDDDKKKSDDDKLMGIRAQADMNQVLWNWHMSKPPLLLRKEQPDGQDSDGPHHGQTAAGKLNGYDGPHHGQTAAGEPNGYLANGHAPALAKKEWAVYYSKV